MPPIFHSPSKLSDPTLASSPNFLALSSTPKKVHLSSLKAFQGSCVVNASEPLRPQPTGPFLKGEPEKWSGFLRIFTT